MNKRFMFIFIFLLISLVLLSTTGCSSFRSINKGKSDETKTTGVNNQKNDGSDASEPGKSALFPVTKDGFKYGYMNINGKLVIDMQYSGAKRFSDGLAPVKVEKKWGFIDEKGKMVIDPQFEAAEEFSEGFAAVMLNNKWGFIDTSGKMVIEPQFSVVAYPGFKDGASKVVMSGGESRYVLKNGSIIESDEARYKEGLIYVKVNGKWGFMDENGKMVIEPQFDYASYFSEGLAAVGTGNFTPKWGFIDKTGKYVIEPQFTDAHFFLDGMAVAAKDEKYGFIDKEGNFVIEPQFKYAYHFSDGLAPVQADTKWGYIDKAGKFVVEPQYSRAGNFSDGIAAVEKDSKFYGYIDTSGKVIVSKDEYESISKVSEDLICVGKTVGKDKMFGLMDKSGKLLTGLDFYQIFQFNNGLAEVKLEKGYKAYIDKTGKIIWDPRKN